MRCHREWDLTNTFALYPDDLVDDIPSRSRLLFKLNRQLCHMEELGLRGDWAYEPARHRSMQSIIAREREELDAKLKSERDL